MHAEFMHCFTRCFHLADVVIDGELVNVIREGGEWIAPPGLTSWISSASSDLLKAFDLLKSENNVKVRTFLQWPQGLRRGPAASRLLGLWVQIPPGAWMSVSCECCVLSEVSVTSWWLVQRSPTECGVSVCDRESSIMRRPTRAVARW